MSLTPVGDWIRKTWPPNPGATHYLGPGDDPGCAAGGHASCTYNAGWREGLRSLAAWFDRNEGETAAETGAHHERGDDDAGCMAAGARDAWRDAAREARLRAGAGSEGDGGAVPVSPDAGEAQGRTEPLSASLPQAAIDAAAHALATYGHVGPPRAYTSVGGANASIAAAMLTAALPHILAAERERIALLLDRKRAVFCRPCDGEVCDYSDELTPASELVRGSNDG